MTRAENSALIALTELQDMERDRAERELQLRLAEQERHRAQQRQRERLALEAKRRQAAEEETRRVETERQRVWEAADARRRIEQAEATARAEQDARLVDVQRQLSTELNRRKIRHTGRLAAMGMGTALLASVATVAVWLGTPRPAEPARVAVEVPAVDVDALSRGLARLREDNASLRDDLREIRARAETVAETSMDDDAAGTEPAPTERSRVRPRRPHPRSTIRRPMPPPASGKDQPLIKKRAVPLVLDDDSGDPLSGLEKKPEKKKQ